ncbi:MAG: hypothetical protein QOF72_961 [Blastocatellia bacterium]|jgi:hypothetical protein|nr:hypothetical protein [Blastocatellia bacterium]
MAHEPKFRIKSRVKHAFTISGAGYEPNSFFSTCTFADRSFLGTPTVSSALSASREQIHLRGLAETIEKSGELRTANPPPQH